MILVLEGPDGTGKTTLANAFQAKYPDAVKVFHSEHREDQYVFDSVLVDKAIDVHLAGGIAILDRSWIGDGIYGPVFRGTFEPRMRWLDARLRRYGATYVICAPPAERVEELFQKLRTERPEKFTTQLEVARQYRALVYGGMKVEGTVGALSYPRQNMREGWFSRDDVVPYDRTDRDWKEPPIDWLYSHACRVLADAEALAPRRITGLVGRPSDRPVPIGPGWQLDYEWIKKPILFLTEWPMTVGDHYELVKAVHETGLDERHFMYLDAFPYGSINPAIQEVSAHASRVFVFTEKARQVGAIMCHPSVREVRLLSSVTGAEITHYLRSRSQFNG